MSKKGLPQNWETLGTLLLDIIFWLLLHDALLLMSDLARILNVMPSEWVEEAFQMRRQEIIERSTRPTTGTIYVLQGLLEVTISVKLLAEDILLILDFSATILEDFSRYLRDSVGTCNLRISNMECEDALKTLLVLLNKLHGAFQLKLDSLVTLNPEFSVNSNHPSFRSCQRILIVLFKFMNESTVYPKECACTASLAFCTVVKLITSQAGASEECIAKHFFNWFFNDSTDQTIFDSFLPGVDFKNCLKNFSVLTKLYVCHGILTSLPHTVLTQPFTTAKGQETLLLSYLFPAVCAYCHSCTDRFSRFFALQLLHSTLQQIHQFSKDENPLSITILQRHVTDAAFFDSILEFVWKYWEDRFEPIVVQA